MLFPKVWVYTYLPFLRHKLAYRHHHTQKSLTFHLYTTCNLSNQWFKPQVGDHSKWTHFLKVKFGLQSMIHLVSYSNHTHTYMLHIFWCMSSYSFVYSLVHFHDLIMLLVHHHILYTFALLQSFCNNSSPHF